MGQGLNSQNTVHPIAQPSQSPYRTLTVPNSDVNQELQANHLCHGSFTALKPAAPSQKGLTWNLQDIPDPTWGQLSAEPWPTGCCFKPLTCALISIFSLSKLNPTVTATEKKDLRWKRMENLNNKQFNQSLSIYKINDREL